MTSCLNCEEPFDPRSWEDNRKFCSLSCSTSFNNKKRAEQKEKQARREPIKWSDEVSYLSGLIVTDGSIDKNRPRIDVTSSDKEQIQNVADIVERFDTGGRTKPQMCGKEENVYWRYQWTSRRMTNFLYKVGVEEDKMFNLGELNVPKEWFMPFFRGVVDGDGCTSEDRIRIHNANREFLEWIRQKTKDIIDCSPTIWESDCFAIRYNKKDSLKLKEKMDFNGYYLSRKWDGFKSSG